MVVNYDKALFNYGHMNLWNTINITRFVDLFNINDIFKIYYKESNEFNITTYNEFHKKNRIRWELAINNIPISKKIIELLNKEDLSVWITFNATLINITSYKLINISENWDKRNCNKYLPLNNNEITEIVPDNVNNYDLVDIENIFYDTIPITPEYIMNFLQKYPTVSIPKVVYDNQILVSNDNSKYNFLIWTLVDNWRYNNQTKIL